MAGIKEEAARIVEALAEDATWDDLMYAIYVHEKVDQGRQAVAEERVVPQDKARKGSVPR
jgi:hypothetical protein